MLLFTMGIRIMGHSRIQNNGFTIIEAIAVLLIIGVIGSVVLISWNYSTSVYDLTSQTEVIKSHLRYAQARAMNTDVVWGVHFETNNTYKLFKYDTFMAYVNLPGESSDTITLEDMTLSPSGATVYVSFDSWGKPYTDVASQTSQAEVGGWRDVSVSLGGDTQTISIRNNTGFIP
jgi:prepilin-type N-terminal cleavage/methylation domain